MEKLYLGIELDDTGCGLSWFDSETKTVQVLPDQNGRSWIPSVLCLNAESNQWSAGVEAESAKGNAGCIVLNRLVSLFRSGQSLEVNGECYTAEDMMQEFLHAVLQEAIKRSGINQIESLVFCLEKVYISDVEAFSRICSSQGVDREAVHVFNRQECFMYYLMSQKREMWSNVSYLLDYGEKGLCCYELNVLKGLRPVTASAYMENITGAPSLEQIKSKGEESAAVDRWFSSLAEKKLTGKIVSSVFLCGEGFSDLSWAKQFIKSIYSQKSRKIYQVEAIYGMGAAFAAYHVEDEYRHFPYRCICEGRISTTVSIFVDEKDGSEQLILVQAGMNCYEARTSVELNLIDQKELNLFVRNTGAQESYKLSLDLTSFMADHRERTKIRLSMVFPKEDTMIVKVEDLGFGEIYPSTGSVVQQSYKV